MDTGQQTYKFPEDSGVTWFCRFHPAEWFHEVGCPHVGWTARELYEALVAQKRFSKTSLTLKLARSMEEKQQQHPDCIHSDCLECMYAALGDGYTTSDQQRALAFLASQMEALEEIRSRLIQMKPGEIVMAGQR